MTKLTWLAIVGLMSGSLPAQVPAQVPTPPPGAGPPTKPATIDGSLRLLPSGAWYQTFSVELMSLVPGNTPRPVRVEIRPTRTTYRQLPTYQLFAETKVELPPAGNLPIANPTSAPLPSTTVVMSVPSALQASYEVWVVEEGGPDLFLGGVSQYRNDTTWTLAPAVLMVGARDSWPTDGLAAAVGVCRNERGRPADGREPALVDGFGNIWHATLPSLDWQLRERLFERWIDYSGLDIVFVSSADLTWLGENAPHRLRALGDWLAVGGNLIVFDQSLEDEALTQLEEHLAPASPHGMLGLDQPDAPPSRWRLPNPDDYTAQVNDAELRDLQDYRGGRISGMYIRLKLPRLEPGDPNEDPWFRWRSHGRGMLIAMDWRGDLGDDGRPAPLPADSARCAWLLNTLGVERWWWPHRAGFTPNEPVNDFWTMLVPGTGRTPVGAFQLLITLFAVVIGPVNYWLLRRAKRLPLLVITVPAIALVTSAALGAYALVSDGLSVRMRTRSYTEIDQRTGQATCWARLSYYAGVSPPGGLTFARDVAVYPQVEPMLGDPPARTPGRIRLTDDKQHYYSGWLRAREPAQFVTARSRSTTAALTVSQIAATTAPRVTNGLGVRLDQVLLVDERGECFTGSGLAPGEVALLEHAELRVALDRLRRLHNEHQPTLPAEMLETGRSQFFGFRSQSHEYWQYEFLTDEYSGALLDKGLEWLAEPRRWLDGQNQALPAVRRTWVAIADGSPELDVGLSDVRREACYDVIRGHW